MSVRAMKAGALEFLTKPFRDQDLLDAIEIGLERSRVARAAELESAELRKRHQGLTPRERQVLILVVAGMLNKQIGVELSISEKTVKIHRGNVMRKMQVESVADLVRLSQRLPGD
jgi:FixJ family two-component response regulator